jgi:hypothetical protein
VTFHNFYAGSANISVCQAGTCHFVTGNPIKVTPGVSTTVVFKTPSGIIALRSAYVIAGSLPQSNSVTVTP